MDKKHRKLLLKHRLQIVKDLDAVDISSALYEEGIITENDRETLEVKESRRERVEYLLDLLPRKGPKAFDGFCKTLEESGIYNHLSSLLSTGGKNKDKKMDLDFPDGFNPGRRGSDLKIRPRSSSKREPEMLDAYTTTSNPRGWCFIINNMNFLTMNDRHGSERDAANLQALFKRLGFRVWLLQDADDIRNKFTELANTSGHNDALVVCILSHGLSGKIYGVEGNLISVSEIFDIISNGPSGEALRGKPKLFLIQACRVGENPKKKRAVGRRLSATAEIIASPSGSQTDLSTDTKANRNSMYDSFIEQNSSHLHSDMLLGYSTFPGKVSWRHSKHGSFFIDALVDVFNEYASTQDVFSMLIKVNQKVFEKVSEEGQEQIPAPVVTLTKKLYLHPIPS